MSEHLIQLIILFLVIIDPLASVAVFLVATKSMDDRRRARTAFLSVLVAAIISVVILLLGTRLLDIFGIAIGHLKIAGGIIMGILGVEMALGYPLMKINETKEDSTAAIASIIATPLLTGPATMTAIIISTKDFGINDTALALGIVLIVTLAILLLAVRVKKLIGQTSIQVLSTILGLITLAWGVKFILSGLGLALG